MKQESKKKGLSRINSSMKTPNEMLNIFSGQILLFNEILKSEVWGFLFNNWSMRLWYRLPFVSMSAG